MASPPLPLLSCLLAFAACAAAPSPRLALTPLGAPTAAGRIETVRADADRSAAPVGAPSPFVHDPAIRALYGDAAPAGTTAASDVATTGATVDAPSAATTTAPTIAVYDAYGYRRAREPFVPAATVFGAGLGAALSARGHRSEGALLGAGIGLLFDLQNAGR
ncbi:MAG: hypothetical protein FJ301_12690 [Planctomycetes bacterium]|nr:hypothetical protein [Planctomycetota bacterium]